MHVICGAGLAGLSLAVALVRAGVTDDVVLVDRRTTFERDRTWCTWSGAPLPARARWDTWEVVTSAGTGTGRSAATPYVMLDSRDVYAALLEELDAAPNVTLRLGEAVLELGDGVVRTARETLHGRVYDALALGSPALRGLAVERWQAFLGWEVVTERPIFDPGRATLMDFRCPQPDDGVGFVYTLPLAPDRALVEHTTFARSSAPPDERRALLRAHLGDVGHEVVHEERGRIPMTATPLPVHRPGGTLGIGTAGGAVRGSSGYAFTRIGRQARAVAAAVAAGTPVPARAGSRRHGAMDAVFLRALADTPEAFPELFRSIVGRVPGAAFARFMTDRSGLLDELLVIAATPKRPFIAAAAHTVVAERRRAAPGVRRAPTG